MTGNSLRQAIVLIASMSGHWPYSDTGMIAFVRGVMAASSFAASML